MNIYMEENDIKFNMLSGVNKDAVDDLLEEIANITEENATIDNILPLTVPEVLEKANVIVALYGRKLIAMITISDPEKNSRGEYFSEIGGMFVRKEHRNHEIAVDILEEMLNWARHDKTYFRYRGKPVKIDGVCAFTNDNSFKAFTEKGFTAKDATEIVPEEMFRWCRHGCTGYCNASNLYHEKHDEIESQINGEADVFKAAAMRANLEYREQMSRRCCDVPMSLTF